MPVAAPDPATAFEEDGFAVLPGYLTSQDLGPAIDELAGVFPTAAEFHDDVDPERNERFRDEFGGIVDFPFASPELSLLAVHPRLVKHMGPPCVLRAGRITPTCTEGEHFCGVPVWRGFPAVERRI